MSARNLVIPFGKYRGSTILNVAKNDFPYVWWLSRNAEIQAIRDAANEVVNDRYAAKDPLPMPKGKPLPNGLVKRIYRKRGS